MSKKLVHWAARESAEEEAIIKAAKKVGIEPEKAAHIIDDIFRFFREGVTDFTMPEIIIGNFLRIYPNVHKLQYRIVELMKQVKLGIRDRLHFLYVSYPLFMVRRRLIDYKYMDVYERRATELKWRKLIRREMEEELEKRHKAFLDSGNSAFKLKGKQHEILKKTMRNIILRNKERSKKFREWKSL